MIGPRITLEKGARDEAEKPFWISYADLMTSLAVLFLVVMIAFIVSLFVQQKLRAEQLKEQRRTEQKLIDLGRKYDQQLELQKKIAAKRERFELDLAQALRPLKISVDDGRILFGDLVRFENNSARIDPATQALIRRAVMTILTVYRRSGGAELLRNVNVEGFASATGSYFNNLELSQMRSASVMCAVLTGSDAVSYALDRRDQDAVARLFALGGRSSNDVKPSDEESRRVEMGLEYAGTADSNAADTSVPWDKIFDYNDPGNCPVTR